VALDTRQDHHHQQQQQQQQQWLPVLELQHSGSASHYRLDQLAEVALSLTQPSSSTSLQQQQQQQQQRSGQKDTQGAAVKKRGRPRKPDSAAAAAAGECRHVGTASYAVRSPGHLKA
jgi:hypothetical protein